MFVFLTKDIYFFRNNLCSYTKSSATDLIRDGRCNAICWKSFFNVETPRNTPCKGDKGTSVMVQENFRLVKKLKIVHYSLLGTISIFMFLF